MVVLHVKRRNESLFLYEATVNDLVSNLLSEIVRIQNGRLKIDRISEELEYLAEHGVCLPPAMQGLSRDQVTDLKLVDSWTRDHIKEDNHVDNPDTFGKRNGKAPVQKFADVLTKTAAEAKAKVSKKLVDSDINLQYTDIQDALDMLKGAVMIAYPMGLPSYDTVQQELENKQDLSGIQAGKEVFEETCAELWWAGKQLKHDQKLSEYIGKNEKTKIVVKLQKKGEGAPSLEPIMTPEQQKELVMAQHMRQEEMKRLEAEDDDSYLNSTWADNRKLQKSFQGLTDIKFNFR